MKTVPVILALIMSTHSVNSAYADDSDYSEPQVESQKAQPQKDADASEAASASAAAAAAAAAPAPAPAEPEEESGLSSLRFSGHAGYMDGQQGGGLALGLLAGIQVMALSSVPIGAEIGGFWGNTSDVSDDDTWVLPFNLKVGYSLAEALDVGIHGGGSWINDFETKLYPNAGLHAGIGVGGLRLLLRADNIFVPDAKDVHTYTGGLEIPINL